MDLELLAVPRAQENVATSGPWQVLALLFAKSQSRAFRKCQMKVSNEPRDELRISGEFVSPYEKRKERMKEGRKEGGTDRISTGWLCT